MKLEDQVCTFEQAKKLKELGIAQKSWFCYSHLLDEKNNPILAFKPTTDNYEGDISALTVAELGNILDGAAVSEMNISGKWIAYPPHYIYIDADTPMSFKCDTEASCRAMALIELIGNGTLSVVKINERLI